MPGVRFLIGLCDWRLDLIGVSCGAPFSLTPFLILILAVGCAVASNYDSLERISMAAVLGNQRCR